MITRRRLTQQLLALGALAASGRRTVRAAEGTTGAGAASPILPSWEALRDRYRAPDWFRDAKFGIWAHWSAQCVPEAGDWYARDMYIQGSRAYDHHLHHYGHPADVGFMEIDRLWTAANWDPGELLDLYRGAGARYFVALANHHDNFDTYASRFHAWNATRIGPRRDIIGEWARAARARGLRFGVSNHSAHAWHWFQVAYGYDPEGPRRGERYDAWRLTRYDGDGRWWQGLDPQELYGGATMPMPDGIGSIADANAWHAGHDGVWEEAPPLANPAFVHQWALRCQDLLESYQPDLVYFDDSGLPLGQAGLDVTARYYSAALARHGQLDVVATAKNIPPGHAGAVVEDVERGYRAGIEPLPWQTDTCIGDWHYNRERFEKRSYMDAAAVVHRLCDVVSKNGNLLLSVPMRGDGTIDSEERRIVERIGAWNRRYGEAVFATRPWRIHGEGPTPVRAGAFSEFGAAAFTAADIRYTTRERALYAITLGRPADAVTLPALAGVAVQRVEMVGTNATLRFKRDARGLHVSVPAALADDIGVALRIRGGRLA